MELYKAIVKFEGGGSADGALQVKDLFFFFAYPFFYFSQELILKNLHIFQARAESIQSEVDELVTTLNERCKKYGLRVKPTTLLELPFGI